MEQLTDTALEKAQEILGRECSPIGRPMGYPHQAWSAGMYVFAHHCVRQGVVPLLDNGSRIRQGEAPVKVD